MKHKHFFLAIVACIVCSVIGYFIGKSNDPKPVKKITAEEQQVISNIKRDSIIDALRTQYYEEKREFLKALIEQKEQPKSDYQINVDLNGITLMDGTRYVGFVKWEDKTSAIDQLIFKDNQ